MELYSSNDALTVFLRGLNIEIAPHYLTGSRIVLGGLFTRGETKIAYRLDEEVATVVIIYYESMAQKAGLTNQFSDLLWFFDCLIRPELKIEGVKGLVRPVISKETGLSASRLEKFYRILGAKVVETDKSGQQWLGGTVEGYRQWRARRLQLKKAD